MVVLLARPCARANIFTMGPGGALMRVHGMRYLLGVATCVSATDVEWAKGMLLR